MKLLMIIGAAALAAMTPTVAMAQHHGDRGGWSGGHDRQRGHDRSVNRHGGGHVAPSYGYGYGYDPRYRGYNQRYDRRDYRYDRHDRPRHERKRHHKRRHY